MALIEVRSIYDTDGLERMGETMLAPVDLPAGCTVGIAKTAPTDTMDTRARVADLTRMKNPADPAYGCSPARFVRATRAVAPPASTMGLRSAIGETEFEQVQILGYAPVEPDGSFKLKVPADVPLAFSIVDAKGRGIQTHLNWIQVRPGERRTCDGCHSPRRGGALNSGAVVNALPAGLLPSMSAAHQSGETMAALRTRLDATALNLKADMAYTDVWADTSKAGVTALASISVKYTGNASSADDLVTAAPANGLINYPDHIQPLWTRSRGTAGANTCTTCHTDTVKLDLRGTTSGTGRVTSYEELLLGDPVIDAATGLPVTRVREGVPEIVRGAPLVETMSGNAAGMARSSRLAEILFGETLKAGTEAATAHPNPPAGAPNHALMLNAAEKRLVTEWMDLGGQYYNDPFAGGVKAATGLSQTVFAAQVFPILRSTCAASCHQATGSDPTTPAGASFRQNRFVLTGSPEGDFNVSLSMISDTCKPGSNYLLSRPSTVPHPAGAVGQTTAILPVGSAKYTTIANWISGGCP
jgi:Hydrazine synthase alpha subunit middle domain